MGGVVKKGKKLVRKVIPKEIKPALPYIAAFAGQPYLAKGLGAVGTFAANNPAVTKALIASGTAAATQDDPNLLRTAALAAAPDVVSGGLEKLGTAGNIVYGPQEAGSLSGILKSGQQLALKGADVLQPTTFTGAAKLIGGQSAVDAASQLAEIQQDQIDAYNRQLQEQGVMNKAKRRSSIFNIYINAGYDPDYVNSVLDKYGYANGGIAYLANGGDPEEYLRSMSRGYKGAKEAMTKMFSKKKKDKEPKVVKTEEGKIVVNFPEQDTERPGDLASGLAAAAQGVERAFGRGFGNMEPVPMLRFAKGGEVEEEEVSESGIMTVASAPNNFAELNMLAIDLFGRPYDQLSDGEQETLMDFVGSKSQAGGEGIMQMASGYKTDIEEMYEQYVFEMEEMGLQPMSFSEFLAQARSGMAKGGMMKGPDWFTNRVEDLMYQGLSYEEASEQAYNEGPGGGYKDGGKAQRRKKDEPADEIIETEQEIFIDKMPRPKRQGIMEAADGGIMEKDMRGGGFIPEGSKERADDVPARLSKNEFVMTADAVRAAGGGSVNKGAKRMYDLMYTLEGKI